MVYRLFLLLIQKLVNDDDLKILQYIAQHLVILDLTNSQVTDQGWQFYKKFPNLQKTHP